MSKRSTSPAPAAGKPRATRAKVEGQISQVIDGRLLRYEKPRHIVRTLSDRGGPWTESVVATSIANQTLSKALQEGEDLLYAHKVQVVSEGIAFMWMLAVPSGHPGKGLREIKHVTRTITPGMSAIPPAMSAQRTNEYIGEFLDDGFYVFNFMPLGMEAGGGVSAMWVLVR